MRVERPCSCERAVAPDVAEQLVLREHAVRVRGERGEELELLAGKMDVSPRTVTTRASRSIARSPTASTSGRRRRPPQQRPDPREQLVVNDRARQVVVGAALKCPHAVDRVGLPGPSTITGTFRFHVRPGSPSRSRAQSSSSEQSTMSGRVRSASASASPPNAACEDVEAVARAGARDSRGSRAPARRGAARLSCFRR